MIIIFRIWTILEFLICGNALICQFRNEAPLPPELRLYLKARLLLSIIAFILTFFITWQQFIWVIAVRVLLFLIYLKKSA